MGGVRIGVKQVTRPRTGPVNTARGLTHNEVAFRVYGQPWLMQIATFAKEDKLVVRDGGKYRDFSWIEIYDPEQHITSLAVISNFTGERYGINFEGTMHGKALLEAIQEMFEKHGQLGNGHQFAVKDAVNLELGYANIQQGVIFSDEAEALTHVNENIALREYALDVQRGSGGDPQNQPEFVSTLHHMAKAEPKTDWWDIPDAERYTADGTKYQIQYNKRDKEQNDYQILVFPKGSVYNSVIGNLEFPQGPHTPRLIAFRLHGKPTPKEAQLIADHAPELYRLGKTIHATDEDGNYHTPAKLIGTFVKAYGPLSSLTLPGREDATRHMASLAAGSVMPTPQENTTLLHRQGITDPQHHTTENPFDSGISHGIPQPKRGRA